VFDLRGDDMAAMLLMRFGDALNRQVVRFRAAGKKCDFRLISVD
jgi:hypothetical protein